MTRFHQHFNQDPLNPWLLAFLMAAMIVVAWAMSTK